MAPADPTARGDRIMVLSSQGSMHSSLLRMVQQDAKQVASLVVGRLVKQPSAGDDGGGRPKRLAEEFSTSDAAAPLKPLVGEDMREFVDHMQDVYANWSGTRHPTDKGILERVEALKNDEMYQHHVKPDANMKYEVACIEQCNAFKALWKK